MNAGATGALIAAGLLFLAFTGCAGLGHKAAPPDPGLFLLSPASAGVELRVTQALSFSRGEARFESLAAIEVGPEAVALVGLGPLGNRMLALHWDGKKLLEERDPSLPADLPLRLILRDVMLAYWPAPAVQKALPKGWRVEDGEGWRRIYKEDRTIVAIHYSAGERWRAEVAFEHLGLGYRIGIKPLQE